MSRDKPANAVAAADDPLAPVATATLADYQAVAEAFWAGTRDHDVSQNIQALLRHLPAGQSLDILDLGCGPGRDLMAFAALGHRPVGVDGTPAFVDMARAHSGCPVWAQSFLALDLPAAAFDGVFANASLFHVPTEALPRVLRQLHATLRPGGVLFSSNPRGDDRAGWQGGRYGVYHSLEGWRRWMIDAGFIELEHYYRPTGLPCAQQPWLASVWRRS